MQFKFTHVLQGILLISASAGAFADDSGDSPFGGGENSNLTTYLKNLGQYFGYDVTQYCTSGGPCSSNPGSNSGSGYINKLFNAETTQSTEINLFNTYLGALLGGGTNAPGSIPLVPTNTKDYSLVNSLAGRAFNNPSSPYSTPSAQNVSVSPLIDQIGQNYQADPVSQAVLNILTTPDYTFCLTTSAGESTFNPNCPILYREKVMSQVIGSLKPAPEVFSTGYNQPLVAQLDSDTLMSPLLYTTEASNNNNTSSTPDNTRNKGLTAPSQAQQAANFIRYTTGAVTPISLPTLTTYSDLISKALNYSGQVTTTDQATAQITILTYLTKLRTYAAHTSVGVGNLYYILSRRLPQKPLSGNGPPSSQALNEFIMASWRLYNPSTRNNPAGDNQWLTQINKGSSASVQKEIAILLAEINYQLYLTRQQQERLLLTESILLLQSSQTSKPDSTISVSSSGEATPNNDNSTE